MARCIRMSGKLDNPIRPLLARQSPILPFVQPISVWRASRPTPVIGDRELRSPNRTLMSVCPTFANHPNSQACSSAQSRTGRRQPQSNDQSYPRLLVRNGSRRRKGLPNRRRAAFAVAIQRSQPGRCSSQTSALCRSRRAAPDMLLGDGERRSDAWQRSDLHSA